MADKTSNTDSQIATTLTGVLQDTLRSMSNLEFSQDPKQEKRNLIEYESHMRIFGLEKFNGPCYISSISFYKSENDVKEHIPCGTLNLYLEEEASSKILKALGYNKVNDNDEDLLLETCAEFCSTLAANLKNELSNLGYKDLVLSTPVKQKNDITEGVEFPYSQYTYYEIQFFLWKQKAIVLDIVLTPNDSK